MIPRERPIKELLRKPISEASVSRTWNRIDARTRSRSDASGTLTWWAAAAILIAATIVLVVVDRGSFVFHAPTASAVLALHAEEADDVERVIALADRSTITLAPRSAYELLESSATNVALRQSRGRVAYDITPGGPRRWTIECGPVTVEVVGTSFRIDRMPTHVRVDVMRGVVLVRGERVPDRVARLTAGMSIDVTTSTEEPVVTANGAPPPPRDAMPNAAPALPASSDSLRDSIANTAKITTNHASDAPWRRAASRGDNAAAYAELGAEGIARATQSASIDDLMTLADVARLSGHPHEAIGPLERVVAEHAGDPRASLAAHTLGRIQLRSLGAPAAAASSFERAIAMGIPSGLLEDTYALWIESLATAGARDGVKRAYESYRAHFSSGARDAELRKWLEAP